MANLTDREVIDSDACTKCGVLAGSRCVNKAGNEISYVHAVRYKTIHNINELKLVTPAAQASVDFDKIREAARRERVKRIEVVRGGLQLVVALEGYPRMLDHVARLLVEYDVDDVILGDTRDQPTPP